MNNINDISADDSVITELWVRTAQGYHASTDGLGQKTFPLESEAEAFKLGVEYAAERLGGDIVVSDVAYGRWGYVVRFATGEALEVWSN
jgi:hypothetical protein